MLIFGPLINQHLPRVRTMCHNNTMRVYLASKSWEKRDFRIWPKEHCIFLNIDPLITLPNSGITVPEERPLKYTDYNQTGRFGFCHWFRDWIRPSISKLSADRLAEKRNQKFKDNFSPWHASEKNHHRYHRRQTLSKIDETNSVTIAFHERYS